LRCAQNAQRRAARTSRAIATRSAPVHHVPGAASDCHARRWLATMSSRTAIPVLW
jgi:hypothetical protein